MLIKKIFIKTLNQLIYQLNIENLKFIKNNLAFKIRTALNVPNSTSTSLYGPNYNVDTGIYSFVGSYKNTNVSNNLSGFIYNGKLM